MLLAKSQGPSLLPPVAPPPDMTASVLIPSLGSSVSQLEGRRVEVPVPMSLDQTQESYCSCHFPLGRIKSPTHICLPYSLGHVVSSWMAVSQFQPIPCGGKEELICWHY